MSFTFTSTRLTLARRELPFCVPHELRADTDAGHSFLGINFDDHVGDWEHAMVRFVNGVPQYIYLSEHSGGSAYTYSALTETNGRATTYIATGSHANYATVSV